MQTDTRDTYDTHDVRNTHDLRSTRKMRGYTRAQGRCAGLRAFWRVVPFLLAAVLILGTCSGCLPFLSRLFTQEYVRRTVPYGEMVYTRPDTDAFYKKLEDITATVQADRGSYRKQLEALAGINEPYTHYYTMYTLAEVRFAIDPKNEALAAECRFFSDTQPQLEQKLEDLYTACSRSPHCDRFEDDFFGAGFLDAYRDGGTYSDEVVELFRHESELLLRYKEQSVNPEVTYEGRTAPLYDLLWDAETDEAYTAILDAYYTAYNRILGDIYVDLVRTRMQIADALGYDSYADYAYGVLERDYTPDDASVFISGIAGTLVPVLRRLQIDGLWMQLPDETALSPERLIGALEKTVDAMHPKLREAFDFMQQYDLYHIGSATEQVNQTFTTYFEDYDAPFIVMGGTGGTGDFLDFTHEFGHFTDEYLNFNTNFSIDQNECSSQALEYLALAYLQGLDGAEQTYLRDRKMYDTLSLYLTQACYSRFEERVYALDYDNVTLARINEIAAASAAEFSLDTSSVGFSRAWIDIPHFYEQAFYVISYCVSNDAALQIYRTEQEKAGSGVNQYIKLLDWNPDMEFLENLERAGLENPFTAGHMQMTAQLLLDYWYPSGAARQQNAA